LHKNGLTEEALLNFREKATIVPITLAGIEGIKVKKIIFEYSFRSI